MTETRVTGMPTNGIKQPQYKEENISQDQIKAAIAIILSLCAGVSCVFLAVHAWNNHEQIMSMWNQINSGDSVSGLCHKISLLKNIAEWEFAGSVVCGVTALGFFALGMYKIVQAEKAKTYFEITNNLPEPA